MASRFEFIGNWLSKSQLRKQQQEMSLLLWEFSFRGKQGVHSLIYNASPKYVMMISSKSPKAIFVKAQREESRLKDHKVPKADRILEPTEIGMMYF